MATTLEPTTDHAEAPRTVSRKPKKSQRKWLWPAIILIALIVAVVLWRRAHSANANAGIITSTVSRGDLVETVTGTGSVEAQTGAEVHIGSQITGVVKRLYADVGTKVKAGQLIAQLDLPDLQDTYQGALASQAAAQTKYQQQLSGVGQERITTSQAIDQAQGNLSSAKQKLVAAQEAYAQQKIGTPSDIHKAQTALASSKAALVTAQATLTQTQASINLEVAAAQETYQQAQANAANSAALLTRNHELYTQGYIAASAYDQAVATDKVNQSLVRSGQQNVALVQQKVAADLATAKDGVTQAQQNVASSQAALDAANAETMTTAQRLADVNDAQGAMQAAQATYATSIANKANDVLKDQDVAQAKDAATTAANAAAFDRAQVNKAEIRAPISGTVLSLSVQQGETLAAGLSAPTLITVADLSRLEVEDYVSEEDIGKVKLGQKATVVVDAFPGETFDGTVAKINAGSTIQQNVVTYDVVIKISDPKQELRPDMTATVNINVGGRNNALLVPAVAIQLGTSGSTVNVIKNVDGKEETVPVPVQTGGTDGVNVEILSGLNEGDTIVLAGATSGGSRRGPSNPFGPSSSGKGGGGGKGGGRGG
jgi:RND family efflux transporter MFP subunit